jgi:hypothetical protein
MMNRLKRILALGIAMVLATTYLSGCSAKKDKDGAREAAQGFMEAVKSGSKDGINLYSSDEVANGEFVGVFDSEAIKEALTAGLAGTNMSGETQDKLDELCEKFDTMVEEYQITDVAVADDGSATAYVTMKTGFPFDATGSEKVHEAVAQALAEYDEQHLEELKTLSDEQGEDAANEKAQNDRLMILLDIYEDEIASSEPVTYMLALTLLKNEETDSWYVSAVQSYDSSIAGTGVPAKQTDTSATEVSSSEALEKADD